MLINAGHQVSGLHRNPEQAKDLLKAGVKPFCGDIMDMSSEDFVNLTQNYDVIIFSAGAAGSGLDRTSAIDGEGVTKAIHAAIKNGISRFYLVSAFMDAGRDLPQKDKFEHYMSVKRQSDNALVATGLKWVILRPGALTNEEGNGRVNANLAIPFGPVSRSNVAAMLTELVQSPDIYREIIELTDGEIAVQDAIKSLRR